MERGSERAEATGGELRPSAAAVPGLARIAAGAWYRGAAWGIDTTVRASRRLGAAALSGESAGELLGEARDETVRGVRRILGVDPAEEPLAPAAGASGPPRARAERNGRGATGAERLREHGARLLDRAADVHDERDPIHPGFVRIVDQLAPDEARILKLLANDGPQGIVYVNKAAPFGFGAREIARRLSMIGHEAGLLHAELVPAYLDNLVSHGLVAIRRDALDDELPYQVIEAQPEVIQAIGDAGGTLFRGQITRRSVHLTDFGRAFCEACFPPEHLSGRTAAGAREATGAAVVAPPDATID